MLIWRRPPCLLRRVTISLKDDPTIALEGVLWSMRGPWFTLRSASMGARGDVARPMDGEVVIHLDNISFLQVAP